MIPASLIDTAFLIMLIRCSGLDFSIFSLFDLMEHSEYSLIFYLLYGCEYVLVGLLCFVITIFLFLATKIKIWHSNLTIISCSFASVLYIFAIGRIMLLITNVTSISEGIKLICTITTEYFSILLQVLSSGLSDGSFQSFHGNACITLCNL